MKQLVARRILLSALCLLGAPCHIALAGLGGECKAGIDMAKQKIAAITDSAKKQEAQQHEKAAYVDLKSGAYQSCADELKKIDELAK